MESSRPINEITSDLQRQFWQKNKSRHTTSSLREDTTLIFENLQTNNWHHDGVTRGSFKLILLHPLQNSRVKHYEKGVKIIHRWMIEVVFEIMVVSKMCKNCFLKSRLISSLNSWVALKIKVDIKMRQNPHFYPT